LHSQFAGLLICLFQAMPEMLLPSTLIVGNNKLCESTEAQLRAVFSQQGSAGEVDFSAILNSKSVRSAEEFN
jgi:hypothetical protein